MYLLLNIGKGESRESSLLEFFAEANPILFKDSEKREQRKTEIKDLQFDSAEPQPIFYKYSE